MEKPTCMVAECGRPVRCKMRCRRHYDQWIRTTPADERQAPGLRSRILAMVSTDENGCWLWQGYIGPKGYGQVRGRTGTQSTHRAAYEEWNGPLAEGVEPDHLCRVRSCVNPEHLEAVDHRENLLRSDGFAGRNARKTHCPQGHPYAGDNLIERIDCRGDRSRKCRTCRDARNRARYS